MSVGVDSGLLWTSFCLRAATSRWASQGSLRFSFGFFLSKANEVELNDEASTGICERIPFTDAALRRVGITGFRTSSDYWERRYRKGGNSGAGGYRNLTEFRARVVNDFVSRNRIQTVIEHESGDGCSATARELSQVHRG
jgi:hypothetical protein